jgi:hypothetical protein
MSIFSALRQSRQFGQQTKIFALAGLFLWALLAGGVFFSTQSWTGLYYDNQVTYFVQGLRLSGQHPYLDADWFANTRPLHIAFTWLVAGLSRIGILAQATAALDLGFRLVFLVSLGLLSHALLGWLDRTFLSRPLMSRLALTLSVISLYILSLWPVHLLSRLSESLGVSSLAIALEQFGFYYSFGGFAAFRYYTEPAAFAVLIFTALALLPYRRWRLAVALLGIAGLMHASFLIHTGILAGLLALYLFLTGERKPAFTVAAIYALLVLPLVIYITAQLTDSATQTANQILSAKRVPHHTDPHRWWDATDTWHAGFTLAALLLAGWKTRGPLRLAVLVTGAYVGISIGLVSSGLAPQLGILMPWRASGYLYAFSQIMLLSAGLAAVAAALRRWPAATVVLAAILSLGLLVWGASQQGLYTVLEEEYADTSTQPEYPLMEAIRQSTPEDAVLLIPLRGGDYRLGAQRPVYVDWKSHPYLGEEVLEWWQRVQFMQEFYDLPGSERLTACSDAGADFYVLPADQLSEEEVISLARNGWGLVACPGQ